MDLLTVIEHCRRKEIPALIISLDMEKAFEKTEMNILDTVLEKMGFGGKYRYMVQLLYKNITSCTINNGYTSEYFKVERSLRQGCPYSPPAFLVIAEVLGQKLRQNDSIQGIGLGNKQKKHGQYADDIWASIIATEQNVHNLFKEIDEFTRCTGLNVNYNKTQVLRIGSLRNTDAKCYAERQLHWSDHVKILGIEIHSEVEKTLKSYQQVLEKIQKVCEVWALRGMSTIGRVLIINTLAVSQTVYKLFCLPTPEKEFFTKIKQVFRDYVWDKKGPKIAYDTLMLNIEQGGLKLVDMELKNKAIKISWVHRSLISKAILGLVC